MIKIIIIIIIILKAASSVKQALVPPHLLGKATIAPESAEYSIVKFPYKESQVCTRIKCKPHHNCHAGFTHGSLQESNVHAMSVTPN